MSNRNTSALVELTKGQQTVKFQELVTAPNGDRLRVAIESDSYRFQCRAIVERFDGAKWQRVWHIEPAAMKTREGLAYLPRDVVAADFKADRDALLAAAAKVLNVAKVG